MTSNNNNNNYKTNFADKIGYWTSQEQYSMLDLLKFVIEAERNGFRDCMTSDHGGGMMEAMGILHGSG